MDESSAVMGIERLAFDPGAVIRLHQTLVIIEPDLTTDIAARTHARFRAFGIGVAVYIDRFKAIFTRRCF